MGRSAVNAEKKKKTGRTKTLKSEEKKKNEEYQESQLTTIYRFLRVAGYLNIHKYTNYN